ncbi:hypothetical protein HDU79_011918, partial [Rhizoclosmatium sp. JEL0117]
MSDLSQHRQCPCSNIHVRVDGTELVDTVIRLPPLALKSGGSLFCLNCGATVYEPVGDSDSAESGVVVSAALEPSSSSSTTTTTSTSTSTATGSDCFAGIEIAAFLKAQNSAVKGFDANQKHLRKVALRQRFDDFKERVRSEAEDRILQAQAECAWLCDRIQAAAGECESSGEMLDTIPHHHQQQQQPTTLQLTPISKEQLLASSPHHGSLLSRNLISNAHSTSTSSVTAASTAVAVYPTPINTSSPPTSALSTPAPQRLSSHETTTTATSQDLPRDSLSRKVHFKETTPSVPTPPLPLTSSSATSRSFPSPAAPDGATIEFGKGAQLREEDMFEIDSIDQATTSGEESGRYLEETEDDLDFDEESGVEDD